jgi:hypothetical protein
MPDEAESEWCGLVAARFSLLVAPPSAHVVSAGEEVGLLFPLTAGPYEVCLLACW